MSHPSQSPTPPPSLWLRLADLVGGYRRLRTLKNALANLISGGAAALLAVALPPFLVRLLPPATYGAWALILDVGAFTGLLKFGVQIAVGRYVARARELDDAGQRDEIVNTALLILAVSALLGLLLVALLAWQLARWCPQMPPALQLQARPALLLLGGSMALGLPFAVFSGIFSGLERFEIPAAVNGLSRLIVAVVLVLIAWRHGGLLALAWGWAGVGLATYAVQFALNRGLVPEVRLSWRFATRRAAKELVGYCTSLGVWNVAMLLIGGLDTTLVGWFDFSSVAFYATAGSVIVLIAGIENAIFTPLVPVSAALDVRPEAKQRLGQLLVATTRYGMYVLLATGLPFLLVPRPILRLWVGPLYALHTAVLLQVLVAANIVRLSATPYAMLLMGTGQQRLVVVTPLLEGVTNLCVSVIAGRAWGALGVALGTLVGAAVAMGANFVYNMPRTNRIAIVRAGYAWDGMLRPVLTTAPLLLVWFIGLWSGWHGRALAAATVLALALCAILVWTVGVDAGERRRLRGLLLKRPGAGALAHG